MKLNVLHVDNVTIAMLITIIVNALFSLKRVNYCKLFSCALLNIDILRLLVKLNHMCSL